MQIDQKTNNYTNKDYAIALAKIIVLSGVSSEIEEYETQIIIEWLKKHFRPRPHPSKANVNIYSPEYLVKIWEYGAGGSFKMPENYTKLSCEYIGRVITAFKEWRRSVNMRPKLSQVAVKELPPKSEQETNRSILEKEFNRYKEKGIVFLGSIAYDILVDIDHFDATLYEDYEDTAKALETSERAEQGRNSGDLITYRNMLNNIKPQSIKDRAKRMAVEDYFKTIDAIEI
jgi:hypothetical protein